MMMGPTNGIRVNMRLSPADCIDGDEFGLGNILKVRYLSIQFVVGQSTVAIVLNTNVIFILRVTVIQDAP